jgi:hypothetical protein
LISILTEKKYFVDSIVTSIINKFTERAVMGEAKYGTNLDRKDLSTLEWIEHAQDELMDGILYLEKLKQEHLEKSPRNSKEDSTNETS